MPRHKKSVTLNGLVFIHPVHQSEHHVCCIEHCVRPTRRLAHRTLCGAHQSEENIDQSQKLFVLPFITLMSL